jgi:glucan phosphoethanolaminetransferase (alkaline phosphatase superfamily)
MSITTLMIISAVALIACISISKYLRKSLNLIGLTWLIGIAISIIIATFFRGIGVGAGQAGEHIDDSRNIVVGGFWLSLAIPIMCIVMEWLKMVRSYEFSNRKKLLGWSNDNLIIVLKILSVAYIFYGAPHAWWETVLQEADLKIWFRHWVPLATYLIIYSLLLISVSIMPFIRNNKFRASLSILFFVNFSVDQLSLSLQGNHLTRAMVETALLAQGMTDSFLKAYKYVIIQNLIMVFFTMVPFLLVPPKKVSASVVLGVFPIIAISMMILFFNPGKSEWTNGEIDPAPLPFSGYINLWDFWQSTSVSTLDRDPVDYNQGFNPLVKNIVVLVDEAVRGDYLGFNNESRDNTPFLVSAHKDYMNYGVALSSYNCSVTSRFVMRIGLQREQIPDRSNSWKTIPTIWQYARQAGYKTIFVDAFNAFGKFHSYMDIKEAMQIDDFRAVLDIPYNKRDMAIAGLLPNLLKGDEKKIIYINKYGVHLPYDDSFPADLNYSPQSLQFASFANTDVRRESIKEYNQALYYSVDMFFSRVLPLLDKDTILIYTSDHGQSLYESASEFGHCNQHPVSGEAYVPLLVSTQNPSLAARLALNMPDAYNHASHFEIFPTLLELMGYSEDWVTNKFKSSLLNFHGYEQSQVAVGTISDANWIDVVNPKRLNMKPIASDSGKN